MRRPPNYPLSERYGDKQPYLAVGQSDSALAYGSASLLLILTPRPMRVAEQYVLDRTLLEDAAEIHDRDPMGQVLDHSQRRWPYAGGTDNAGQCGGIEDDTQRSSGARAQRHAMRP